MRPDTPEQPLHVGIRFQQLKHAIRGNNHLEPPAQDTMGHIANLRPRFGRGHPGGLQLLDAAREHGRGPINAVDRAARCRQREEHTASPAPQFQHRGVCRREACRIEGNVIRNRRIGIIVLCSLSANIVLHACFSSGIPPWPRTG